MITSEQQKLLNADHKVICKKDGDAFVFVCQSLNVKVIAYHEFETIRYRGVSGDGQNIDSNGNWYGALLDAVRLTEPFKNSNDGGFVLNDLVFSDTKKHVDDMKIKNYMIDLCENDEKSNVEFLVQLKYKLKDGKSICDILKRDVG